MSPEPLDGTALQELARETQEKWLNVPERGGGAHCELVSGQKDSAPVLTPTQLHGSVRGRKPVAMQPAGAREETL